MSSDLFIWKFMIGKDEWLPIPGTDLQASAVVCACVAPTEKKAREHAERFARENGLDPRWLAAARVVRLEIADGTFVTWVEA